MTVNAAAPSTPTVAIARVLRGLGLKQGRGKDFTVTGYYRRGERLHTYVDVRGSHARQVIAEHADEIEARAEESGFPFTVSIRYSTAGNPFPGVRNGVTERIRETPPVPEASAVPALLSRTSGARTAKATYSSVRAYLGKEFSLSRTSTGRRSGQRWSEGVQVRTSSVHGVMVDYVEDHAAWGSDGSHRKAKLATVRGHLERRFAVEDHFARDGRLIVLDKPA